MRVNFRRGAGEPVYAHGMSTGMRMYTSSKVGAGRLQGWGARPHRHQPCANGQLTCARPLSRMPTLR